MAKWYENLGKGISGAVSGFTDALGITDSQAPQRAVDAANSGMKNANTQLYLDMQPQLDKLWEAVSNGRGLDQNLNKFDYAMNGAMDQTQQAGQNALAEMNAGDSGNVQSYLNPKMDTMLQNTMQTMQGGAGSALQSSATNRNIANSVASQAGQMWDTAFNQALGDSSHNLQANQQFGQSANQQAGLAQSQLQADNDPIMNWINLNNDLAQQKYSGNVGTAQAATQAAGQSRAIL
jgi:hypothetical protein